MVILITLFSSNCAKLTFKTIIEGKVINFGSREPIENVEVGLKDGIVASGLIDLNTSSDKESITYTDKNGEFYIEINGRDRAFLSMGKENYSFDPDWYDNLAVGVKGYDNGHFKDQVFEMKANAYFKPTLKSKDITYYYDTVIFEIVYYSDCYGWSCNGWDRIYIGEGPFCSLEFLSIGHTYQPYRITLMRQGKKTVKVDSVFMISLETYDKIIYY